MNLFSLKYFQLLIVCSLASSLPYIGFSQMQLVKFDSIEVSSNGEQLLNPWAGGFNSPQFSEIDLNNDGIKDLFTFERDWYGMSKCFLNKGGFMETYYVHSPEYEHLFPSMQNWALLADYNCDGKADIFTSATAGIAVYRNDSQETLSFTKVSSLLKAETPEGLTNIFVSPPDLPAITDIDMDGDLDILSFGILGNTVFFYKNLSMEKYGNCEALEFELATECWGYFSESSQDNSITLFDSCENKKYKLTGSSRHAGSTLLAIDLNNDMLKDILIGDISYSNTVMLNNGGSIDEAYMTYSDTSYPSYDVKIDLNVFPATYHVDINNDNKKDLIVSPNNPLTSENFNNIWYYNNISSSGDNVFEFKGTSFLQEGMIDVGEGAKASFIDINNDGLLDILTGNFGYYNGIGNYESSLLFMINTGTSTLPKYDIVDIDYNQLSVLNLSGIYPCFGDMDNDGDMDMISGDEEGKIHLFSNNALPGQNANFILTDPNYMNIDVGESSIPQVYDIDNDGKLDLLVGEKSGTINYFKNTGTAEQAFFSSSPTNDFFGGIDVMEECCGGYSSPYITQDTVGNSILYVSSEDGHLYKYGDIDGNLNGQFKLEDSLFVNALRATVSGGDINNDGKDEIIIGEFTGGISILKNGSPSWLAIPNLSKAENDILIFPNPATNKIKVMSPSFRITTISVHNIMGQLLKELSLKDRPYETEINISDIKTGIYVVSVHTNKLVHQKKLFVN
ncbi:MAG: T9SS type A sorting domain-containing protein [Lentimicrobiaceae bacterium]|jgi:hypothetical protein|nr:T9SS type A sorting domain-containing protein [Lentimicrobiaceae bacterium]MBT3454674.1 T9SS type A sorting domain-containing protein [Lentimicrobiaceae bacterium]MBT3819721.1 T9SS type A sorting domain-containing protein [Lentimicrobiaceae bacterium]MBT4061200.1 T9SS type A sorting domain-containing protein [Lentimicrobiaceae bacterium]MBT4191360.1 T9SS type A sorting domain-containing protein [Lentimicrobiaceae bacterium]